MNVLNNRPYTKKHVNIEIVFIRNSWEKNHTCPLIQSYVAPRATFNSVTCVFGPIMNVVPVSSMAYVVELIIVDPTLTLLKTNH